MRVCDWPKADLDRLRTVYATTANRVLAEQFGRSEASVYAQAKRLGLAKDSGYLRSLPRGFRSRAAVGEERVVDGYQVRKVADIQGGKNWVAVHVLLWEQHRGPVPPNHIVMFKDGDRSNIELDNLECISRCDQLERYTVVHLPAQLREVVWLKGALTRKINARDN